MALVSIEDAARHLRLDYEDDDWSDSDEGQDLALKLGMSESIVVDYLKYPVASETWDEETTPFPVKASVLIVLSDLWEHRAGSASDDVFLSKAVKSLLHRFRDPALA